MKKVHKVYTLNIHRFAGMLQSSRAQRCRCCGVRPRLAQKGILEKVQNPVTRIPRSRNPASLIGPKRGISTMLNSIDSFFIRVITAGPSFQIDSDHQFPGVADSRDYFSSSISPLASGQAFAIAWVVSYSIYLVGGGEGPRVFLPSNLHNSITVGNCARITFRLIAGNADARSLINIYTL